MDEYLPPAHENRPDDDLTHTIDTMMEPLSPLGIKYAFDQANEAVRTLHENGITWEIARGMMVNELHIPMDEASQRLRLAEESTGLHLARGGEGDGTGIDEGPLLPRQRMRNVQVEGTVYRVPKMTQDELAAFVPRCMVCGDPLNARRARARKETCEKTECGIALRQFRRAVVESRKCPACYHPSSPAEREDYKQWRKDRGQMQRRRGNPHGTKPKTAAELLEAALPYLRELRAITELEGVKVDRKQLGSFITQAEKLFTETKAQ